MKLVSSMTLVASSEFRIPILIDRIKQSRFFLFFGEDDFSLVGLFNVSKCPAFNIQSVEFFEWFVLRLSFD